MFDYLDHQAKDKPPLPHNCRRQFIFAYDTERIVSLKPLIKKIHWNTNQNCNLQCSFCYLWRTEEAGITLSTYLAKKLIKEAAQLNVEWFVFGGGDPLMRKDLPELLIYAKQLGLKTEIQTNAILLSDQKFSLIRNYIDKIGLSLDGEDRETHDKIRGQAGHFDIVLKALKRIQEASIPTTIRSIVCKANMGKLSKLGHYLAAYPCVTKWSLREFAPLGRGELHKRDYYITRKDFMTEVENIALINRDVANRLHINSVSKDEMCHCYCLIAPDGSIYTHPENGHYSSVGKFPLQSLTQSISRIKYNSKIRHLRETRDVAFANI